MYALTPLRDDLSETWNGDAALIVHQLASQIAMLELDKVSVAAELSAKGDSMNGHARLEVLEPDASGAGLSVAAFTAVLTPRTIVAGLRTSQAQRFAALRLGALSNKAPVSQGPPSS